MKLETSKDAFAAAMAGWSQDAEDRHRLQEENRISQAQNEKMLESLCENARTKCLVLSAATQLVESVNDLKRCARTYGGCMRTLSKYSQS